MRRSKLILSIILILLINTGLKTWLLVRDVIPFNSDEAIVALMARHILKGELPIFFYGQAYMGSLDAFLVAAGFALFSSQVWVIRLVQCILYILTIIATVFTGRVAFHSWTTAIISGLLMSIPTVNVMLYSTASLGGYGEALLIGSLLLLIGFWLIRAFFEQTSSIKKWQVGLLSLVWGFFAGLGLWANGISLVYSIPMGIALIFGLIQKIQSTHHKRWLIYSVIMIVGCLLGSAPWWIYLGQKGIQPLIMELLGGAVAVEKGAWFTRTLDHLVNLFLLGGSVTLGFRPPWDVRWLAVPLMPFILIFWIAVFIFWIKRLSGSSSESRSLRIFFGILLVVIGGFLFTSFGVDPSGRYFVPLVIPMALVGAFFLVQRISRRLIQYVILTVILVFNLAGTIQCANNYPPGLTTQFYSATIIDHTYDQELIKFLKEKSETRGYTSYWVSYPLAFLSDEEIIFVPGLPYHLDLRYTIRDNRYLPYNDLVKNSSRIAYITARNPQLDVFLTKSFNELDVKWQEENIGDYRVYYQLSKIVHPEEIGLGK